MSPTPYVSVVIPVFNDAIRLSTCLANLSKQSYPRHLYEVVVVDNGSSDNVAEVTSKFDFCRLVAEERPSQFAARNTGIANATGEIIALTDADCLPALDWIEQGVASLLAQSLQPEGRKQKDQHSGNASSEAKSAIVAGEIKVFARNPGKPTSVELYDMATGLTQKNYVEELNYGATANMFFYRETFVKVGKFDEELKCSGDLVWGQKASSLGFNIVYESRAVVEHPARRGFAELHTKAIRTVGGVEDLARRKTHEFTHPLNRSLFRDCIPPIHYCLKISQDGKFTALEKLRMMPVVFFVRYSEALERMRLRMGGVSTRR